MPPAARIGDMHTCPMVNPGPAPHVGGPITLGSMNVITEKKPQARADDMATCAGPPDFILKGSTGVQVNGKMAARMGDPTQHGGVITLGAGTVMIGEVDGGGSSGSGSSLVSRPFAESGDGDQARIVGVMVVAAKNGTPFCEQCAKGTA